MSKHRVYHQKAVHYFCKNTYCLLILLFFVGCNQQKANGENKATLGQPAAQARTASEQKSAVTVVSWNIEWLGSLSNGPRDKGKQLQNTIKVLRYLKADLYCLCEIVDPKSLTTLTAALGSNYACALSGYASGARTSRDPGYANAQKMAFIYNTDRFKNAHTSAYLQADPRAGFYFASGRYPFVLEATVHTAETDQQVDFMIIHGKSGADLGSYDRRLKAADILKTALDKDKKNGSVMLLGDFNDHVKGSITQGKPSPYAAFVQDPSYRVLTLALADQTSTLGYPGVIDQQILSAALNRFYREGSVKIRTDITAAVPDFKRGNTSDHYPVSSVFIFDKERSAAAPLAAGNTNTTEGSGASDLPQNLQQRIFSAQVGTGHIVIRATVKSRNIQFILYNKRQHKVLSVHRKYILKGDSFELKTPQLYKGDYTLVIFSDHGKQVIQFSVK